MIKIKHDLKKWKDEIRKCEKQYSFYYKKILEKNNKSKLNLYFYDEDEEYDEDGEKYFDEYLIKDKYDEDENENQRCFINNKEDNKKNKNKNNNKNFSKRKRHINDFIKYKTILFILMFLSLIYSIIDTIRTK